MSSGYEAFSTFIDTQRTKGQDLGGTKSQNNPKKNIFTQEMNEHTVQFDLDQDRPCPRTKVQLLGLDRGPVEVWIKLKSLKVQV